MSFFKIVPGCIRPPILGAAGHQILEDVATETPLDQDLDWHHLQGSIRIVTSLNNKRIEEKGNGVIAGSITVSTVPAVSE